MATADPRTRGPALEIALRREIARQGVSDVDALDLRALAGAALRAIGNGPAPLDPEGDGLTPPELNASNDI